MRDGWLEGDGLAPGEAGLDWLSTSFDRYYPDDVALPHIFPKGGVADGMVVRVRVSHSRIDLERRVLGDCLKFDKEDEEDSYELVMSDYTGWERLAAEIRRLSGRHE